MIYIISLTYYLLLFYYILKFYRIFLKESGNPGNKNISLVDKAFNIALKRALSDSSLKYTYNKVRIEIISIKILDKLD